MEKQHKIKDKESTLLDTLIEEFGSLGELRGLAIDSSPKLIAYLLASRAEFGAFFSKIGEVVVFEREKFLEFLRLRVLDKSYTAFSNKIGLRLEQQELRGTEKVVLDFPYKDCVLKGGQSKDWQKGKTTNKYEEIFFHNVIARSEIDVLLAPKALQNFELVRHSSCTAISAESAKIAHSLTSSKLNRDFFDNPRTSSTILECQTSTTSHASKSPALSKRMINTPHSQSLHSPNFSSQSLECQDSIALESTAKATPKNSHSHTANTRIVDSTSTESQADNERERLELKNSLNLKPNILIKGNNLLALHTLKKRKDIYGQVKLIYIDPPYNTGNDSFNYSDRFSHSTWLTFMKNRLEIAREFLRDDGVIFIQCDDNEQAYLKVLCDEIFGRENFVGCIVWLKGNAQNDANTLQRNQEYILCYAKNIESKPLYNIKQRVRVKAFKDKKTGKFYYEGAGFVSGNLHSDLNHHNLCGYTIYYNPLTQDIKHFMDYDVEKAKTSNSLIEVYEPFDVSLIDNGYYAIRPPQKEKLLGRWVVSFETFADFIMENRILIKAGKNGYSVLRKEWLDSKQVKKDDKGDYYAIIEKANPPKSFIDFVGSGVGSKENKELFNAKVFNNPKPEALIKYLIEIATKGVAEVSCDDFAGCQGGGEGSYLSGNDQADNADSRKSAQETTPDLVLDFFAGSGTTLAVAHKMQRRWIGIEQMDYIESITKERLKKVVSGEQGGISKAVDFKGGGSFIYLELMALNAVYREKILNSSDEKELEKLYKDLESKAFTNYRVDIQEMLKDKEANIYKEFHNLSLEEKKDILYEILDPNMDYVPYSDIEDNSYGVSDEIIELNRIFYGERDFSQPCNEGENTESKGGEDE